MQFDSFMESRESLVDLGRYWEILRQNFWKVAFLSLVIGVVTVGLELLKPNIYQATAVISPSIDEKKQFSALGALASVGIDIGGPSKVEDLETLFKSKDLIARVFAKHDYWQILLGDAYDPGTGKVKVSWIGRLLDRKKVPKAPGDWDSIHAVKARLRVSINKKANTVSISFESTSAEGSAAIVKNFLEEGKNRLQEEALDRANKNKLFIEGQIGKTIDALTRERLYSLYGQEVEREMMARNREQFGFRVIDNPRVPDRKSKPHRAKAVIFSTLFAFFFFWGVAVILNGKNKG